jgi:hypothetical protein
MYLESDDNAWMDRALADFRSTVEGLEYMRAHVEAKLREARMNEIEAILVVLALNNST